MSPLISVIIPVYNRIGALKRVLDSIYQQTYKDIEIIIVDDGSTEEWPSVIARSEGRATRQSKPLDNEIASSAKGLPRNDGDVDSQAMTVIHQDHKGAPAARNRGLAEAKGEYVIFWDADVVGRKDMLEKMLNALKENPMANYCYSNFQFSIFNFQMPIKSSILDKVGTIFNFSIFKKRMSSQLFNFEALKKCNYIHSTSLIRRKDVVKWDESLRRFQDWDLWLTMAENGKSGVWVDQYLFEVLGGGTMSRWLPSFAYKAPSKWLPFISKSVKKYETAKKIVYKKHFLSP